MSYDWRELQQNTVSPWETMFCGIPPPYYDPSQSRYHNIGLNAFTEKGQVYYKKRPGVLGDYGPSQQGWHSRARRDVYPIDYSDSREIRICRK